jgi:hypothetical protein
MLPPGTEAASGACVKELQVSLDVASNQLKTWPAPIPFVVRHPSCYAPEVLHENILDFLDPKYTN